METEVHEGHDRDRGSERGVGPGASGMELPGHLGRVRGPRDWHLAFRVFGHPRDETIERMNHVKSFL